MENINLKYLQGFEHDTFYLMGEPYHNLCRKADSTSSYARIYLKRYGNT